MKEAFLPNKYIYFNSYLMLFVVFINSKFNLDFKLFFGKI